MIDKVIIYGNVLTVKGKQEICSSFAGHESQLIWREEPSQIDNTTPATIFVDLDDPEFAASEFLISVATTGNKVQVIGKSDNVDLDDSMRVSKLGVSEVLNPEQCLKHMLQFLKELESRSEIDKIDISRKIRNEIIGESSQSDAICRKIELLSDVDFPSALILGETGTGKGLISRTLHSTGVRANHNFVEVNCSAIPDELFESELFGHEKGAFTNAHRTKKGLFEYADNGTLFLDEVGNLSQSAQAKLLKVLEDRRLRKIGSVEDQNISVRVVAATNSKLEEAVSSGRFREDLYFRLNLLTIELPPLRERPEDIPLLVDHYLKIYSTLYSKRDVTLDSQALARMMQYSWPGNMRELCNVIERAVILNQSGKVQTKDIAISFKKGRISSAEPRNIELNLPAHGRSLDNIQCFIIKHVLNMFNWNKTEVANYLKISRPRLRRIIDANGLEQDRREK